MAASAPGSRPLRSIPSSSSRAQHGSTRAAPEPALVGDERGAMAALAEDGRCRSRTRQAHSSASANVLRQPERRGSPARREGRPRARHLRSRSPSAAEGAAASPGRAPARAVRPYSGRRPTRKPQMRRGRHWHPAARDLRCRRVHEGPHRYLPDRRHRGPRAGRQGRVILRGVDASFATQRDVSRTKRDIKTFEVRLPWTTRPSPRGRDDRVRAAATAMSDRDRGQPARQEVRRLHGRQRHQLRGRRR